jgi:hypothetical protein
MRIVLDTNQLVAIVTIDGDLLADTIVDHLAELSIGVISGDQLIRLLDQEVRRTR